MDSVDRILAQWKVARPDLNVGSMGPIGRLSRVFHYNTRCMAETFARHGLNAAGFDVLATLRRSPSPHALSAGELMASMMITSGTMTNRIDQLVKTGHVVRSADKDDARRSLIELTPKGFDLIEEAVVDHVQTQDALLAALSDEDIQNLDSVLRKLLKAAQVEPS